MRVPQTHDARKLTPLVEIARAKGRVSYLGEGKNRLAAAHARNGARVYKLPPSEPEPGARYYGVTECETSPKRSAAR